MCQETPVSKVSREKHGRCLVGLVSVDRGGFVNWQCTWYIAAASYIPISKYLKNEKVSLVRKSERIFETGVGGRDFA